VSGNRATVSYETAALHTCSQLYDLSSRIMLRQFARPRIFHRQLVGEYWLSYLGRATP